MTDTNNAMKVHPLADMVPRMGWREYRSLLYGMRRDGYDSSFPVVVLDGQILDGRHRSRAATFLGLEAPTVEYDGDDPAGFVARGNLQRRHLSISQRAMLAVTIMTNATVREIPVAVVEVGAGEPVDQRCDQLGAGLGPVVGPRPVAAAEPVVAPSRQGRTSQSAGGSA